MNPMDMKRLFVKGLATLLALCATSAGSAVPQRTYLYINGGYTPTSNYAVHEEDLKSFYQGLFGGTGTVLNAGGDDTLVVGIDSNGGFERDESGWVALQQSSFKGKSSPATKENIQAIFKEFAKTAPEEIVAVFGDHGGPEGVALWDGSNFTAAELQQLYANLPSKTSAKSIHLHCYGGALLVDPERELPDTAEQFVTAMTKAYSARHCAVSMSAHDEVGQYYSWTAPWSQTPWTYIFQKNKDISLSKLKDIFLSDPKLRPTPVLTSDYFLADLVAFLCKDPCWFAAANSTEACGPQAQAAEATQDHSATLCDGELPEQIKDKKASYQKYSTRDDELTAIRNVWIIQYIKNQWPKFEKDYRAAMSEIETLQAQFAASGAKRLNEKDAARLKELKGNYPLRWARTKLSLKSDPKFLQYFAGADREWMSANRAKYPEAADFYFYKHNSNYTLEELMHFNEDWSDKIQTERKALEKKFQALTRKVVVPFLDNPRLSGIKKLYEGLDHCESSPLR